MTRSTDTICALATPVGKGGISVVRVSGREALALCRAVTGIVPTPRVATSCRFLSENGELIDAGLTLFFRGPFSFTGEDVCEFHCHGSPVVVDQLLQRLVVFGARLARPGEFSERAFLNDKLDLTQAEAIADLIDSSTVEAARHAVRSLQGEFSRLVQQLVKDVIALRVYIEASIDFSDEEIDFLGAGQTSDKLLALITTLDTILAQAKTGTLLREGLKVVIAGEPNVGKSTLLNVLSGLDLAIVTPIAGTTRDMIHHEISLDGIPLHITDTAGLRDSADPVEAEGMRRARAAVLEADHVLLLVDARDRDRLSSLPLWQEFAALQLPQWTVVFNKIDLTSIAAGCDSSQLPARIFISAAHASGIDLLKAHLKQCAGLVPGTDGGFMARRRHLTALHAAKDSLLAAKQCLDDLNAGELIAEELRNVQRSLDEITGRFTTDDLLGAIFSSFCIGK